MELFILDGFRFHFWSLIWIMCVPIMSNICLSTMLHRCFFRVWLDCRLIIRAIIYYKYYRWLLQPTTGYLFTNQFDKADKVGFRKDLNIGTGTHDIWTLRTFKPSASDKSSDYYTYSFHYSGTIKTWPGLKIWRPHWSIVNFDHGRF